MLDALAWGVIATLIFLTSSIILTIPVFASRGAAQVWWLLAVGFLLTVELAGLVTIGVLIDKGKILG